MGVCGLEKADRIRILFRKEKQMGQRLNIEIIENGKCLANAYYHWSAYTDSSFELAREVIEAIPTINEKNPVLKAIKLLEVTGARLIESDLEYAKEIGIVSDFIIVTNRNDGLIGITEKSIDETIKWQEHALYIYLDEERMNFQVIYNQKVWEWEKDQKEYEDNPKKREDLPVLDIDFTDVKFDKINDFGSFLKKHHEDEFLTSMNQWTVTQMIY